MTEQEQEYLRRIHELEQQVLRLQTEIKKNSETQYGLRWMDVPEAFDDKAENAVPILEEVKQKAITSEDGKPTHILIEGDNYHALTCLNYTHKGAIDVIYIDPPYNTGSDGFVYKDKRVLDKFPDGTTVPTDHPLRHSYWLSFMHKRLELAKNLLSERGVIFISIDDNEQANLKLLCDQVFGEKNFVASCAIKANPRGRQSSLYIAQVHDSLIIYRKGDKTELEGFPISDEQEEKRFNKFDEQGNAYEEWELRKRGADARRVDSPNLYFPIYYNTETHEITLEPINQREIVITPKLSSGEDGRWRWSKEKVLKEREKLYIRKNSKGLYNIYERKYVEEKNKQLAPTIWDYADVNTELGTKLLKSILGNEVPFDYPKPLGIIKRVIFMVPNKQATILDFFGGSGTTMHATMQLNEEDGGHRQCILVQQNENNICEAVTYERNKRVMQGYTNAKGEAVAGLGNSMKYYRTAFVGEHKITDITDADKVALTQKAGCLLALGENTLEEIKTAKSYQIFQLRKGDKPTNDFGYTAVYFSGNLLQFADFRREIEQIQATNPLTRIAVYVFTWGDPSIFENEFDDLSGITIKPIPQPILEIYQNIHQL